MLREASEKLLERPRKVAPLLRRAATLFLGLLEGQIAYSHYGGQWLSWDELITTMQRHTNVLATLGRDAESEDVHNKVVALSDWLERETHTLINEDGGSEAGEEKDDDEAAEEGKVGDGDHE